MEFRRWYYLQESVDLEVLLTEGFKEKKQQFLTQGATREEIDEYFAIFRKIQSSNYKKVADVIPGLTVAIPDRRNIDKYPNFDQLKIFVDYMRSQENLEVDIEVVGEPIFENNILEISYADSPRACISYKGNIPYSWCVSRKAQNYYYTYRLKPHEPSFYFVKNKIRTKKELSSWKPEDIKEGIKWKDPWHFFIIQVKVGADLNDQNALQYVVTSARNDGDGEMSWSEIVQLEPALNGLQQRFKPVALPPEDRAFVERWQYGATDEEFAKMGFKEKSKFMSVYVRLGRGLTDNQFASLPPSLWNEYLNFSVGLTDKQFEMIKDKRELVRRYTELSIRKFNDLVAQNVSLEYLSPSEWKMLKDHGGSLNWDKISDNYFDKLYRLAKDKQTMLDLRLKHRKELSVSNVESILKFTPDLSTIEQTLGQENLNKINQLQDGQIFYLLERSNDREGVLHLIVKYKELTTPNVSAILIVSRDVKATAEKLGQENLNKINQLEDGEIYRLLVTTKDRGALIDIILNHKKLTLNDVYNILSFCEDVKAIEEKLVAENLKKINKLADYQISNLLESSNDLKGILDLIVNYKELTIDNIFRILFFCKDVKAIEEKLVAENLKKINQLPDWAISRLIGYAKDKRGILDLIVTYKQLTLQNVRWILSDSQDIKAIEGKLGKENLNKINKFSVEQIDDLIDDAKDKGGMIHILLNYKEKLTANNIYKILQFSQDLKTIKEEIGEENLKKINLLNNKEIYQLFRDANDKEGVMYVLLKYKELTPDNVSSILQLSQDVKAIEEKIGEENLKKINLLDDFEISQLLYDANDTEGILDLIVKYKELTKDDVYGILRPSQDLKAIEEKLGEKNLKKINLLDDKAIFWLLRAAKDQKNIRYIIAKYRQK